jgi:hypothetical protein
VLCFNVAAAFQLGRAGDIVELAIENRTDLPNQYAQANTRYDRIYQTTNARCGLSNYPQTKLKLRSNTIEIMNHFKAAGNEGQPLGNNSRNMNSVFHFAHWELHNFYLNGCTKCSPVSKANVFQVFVVR